MLHYSLTPAVTQIEQLRPLERAAAAFRGGGGKRSRGSSVRSRRPLGFHLKVDTGMNRLGVPPGELDQLMGVLADCPHLRLDGTFTHFASSEDFTRDQTEEQERAFCGVLERLRAAGFEPGTVHLANSAAIASRPSTWAHMVRPGAQLYGYHQSYIPPERKAEIDAKLPLRPALSLRTRIISLKDVPAGSGVGYNARFVTQRPSRIAVIAAGYADGLVRQLSNRGRVLIRGRCLPLVGTISMDLAMVDVTDLPEVRVGDVVTIYGPDGAFGHAALYASDVAHALGTVTSDLLCALGKRVPRFYLP